MGKVKVFLPYFPYEKYVEEDELVNKLRGQMMSEAINKMKETGKNSVTVICPCCLRRIRISIDDIDK